MDNRKFQAAASATPPAAEASPSTGYPTDGNPSVGTPATVPGAAWFNQVGEELRAVIAAAGLTPSASNLGQLNEAIQRQIDAQSGNYMLDTGAANAYVVAMSPAITAYTDGITVRVRAVNANTGASTLNAGGGAASLLNDIGGALAAADIPAGGVFSATYVASLNAFLVNSLVPSQVMGQAAADARYAELLDKTNAQAVCFTKTAAGTISVLAGTSAKVAGLRISFAAQTAVVMPTLNSGTDYAIYICSDGTIRADANFSAPSGYTTNNSLQVGGFHYGLVGPTETVAGGSFATTGNGMIWTQADVDKIRGINQWSLWDLKFRPVCDPRGMVLVDGMTWVDIYFCNTDPAANGTSKYNTNIASGTVPPKIPAAFGGNGTATYASPTWWDFNEVAHAYGKRMLWNHEFVTAAYGVTENQSIGGAASTYPTTLRNAGYTSKYGIEEATGHHWTWGADAIGGGAGAYIANGGRGQSYANTLVQVILGGVRDGAANSGSRCSLWNLGPGLVRWDIGLRAACDHMQLV